MFFIQTRNPRRVIRETVGRGGARGHLRRYTVEGGKRQRRRSRRKIAAAAESSGGGGGGGGGGFPWPFGPVRALTGGFLRHVALSLSPR